MDGEQLPAGQFDLTIRFDDYRARTVASTAVSHTVLRCLTSPSSDAPGRGLRRIGPQDVEDYVTEAYRRTAELVASGEVPPTSMSIRPLAGKPSACRRKGGSSHSQ